MKAISEFEPVTNSTGQITDVEFAVPRAHVVVSSTMGDTVDRSVRRSIHSSVQRHVTEIGIRIQDESVTISGQARTYYQRQLAEQNARTIVIERLNKRLVSEIVVSSDSS